MKISRGFASDNCSGTHPKILEAIEKANVGHAIAYGSDEYTEGAIEKFRAHFGNDIEVFFVYNGTGANVLAAKAITHSFNSIICAETAHLNVDECCGPEKFTGCKLITIPTQDGKITVERIKPHAYGFGNPHRAQPKVVSITQPTELGTLYSLEEVKALSDFVHEYDMLLHVDGARLVNAAASLNKNLKEITADVGVDVLSFGGTKNAMMFGEAVIFFKKDLAKNFEFIRKQGMQLASKMRFISAQFEALLSDNLWLKNAQHSNRMANLLAEEVKKIPKIKVTQKVEANAVFAIVPKEYIPILQREYFFHVLNEDISEVRWMCSFDTTEDDVLKFVSLLKKVAK